MAFCHLRMALFAITVLLDCLSISLLSVGLVWQSLDFSNILVALWGRGCASLCLGRWPNIPSFDCLGLDRTFWWAWWHSRDNCRCLSSSYSHRCCLHSLLSCWCCFRRCSSCSLSFPFPSSRRHRPHLAFLWRCWWLLPSLSLPSRNPLSLPKGLPCWSILDFPSENSTCWWLLLFLVTLVHKLIVFSWFKTASTSFHYCKLIHDVIFMNIGNLGSLRSWCRGDE